MVRRGPHLGMIKSLHHTFGFIRTEATGRLLPAHKDLFFHASNWDSKRPCAPGMIVSFVLAEAKNRVEARSVRAVKGSMRASNLRRGSRSHRRSAPLVHCSPRGPSRVAEFRRRSRSPQAPRIHMDSKVNTFLLVGKVRTSF